MTDAERRKDRGAFFRSIHGTMSHLLWGDTMWMSRFDGGPKPDAPISQSASWVPVWAELMELRRVMDDRILSWASELTDDALKGDLHWFSGAIGQEVERPKAICIVHFFNHQTHHRGQIHAMMTNAGARPDETDLFLMKDH